MTKRPLVILTALDVEYMAVREKLDDLRPHRHLRGTRFEVGVLPNGSPRIILGLVGKGNHPAAVLAERAVNEFAPSVMFFVGVGGALKPWLPLGDVVVATHVYAPHGGTSRDDGLKSRPRVWETSHNAMQTAQHLARTRTWTGDGTHSAFGVHFGPVAAGEVLLDSAGSAEARWLQDHYNDALLIEMESAGLAQAGHFNAPLETVVVRGASDRADGTKEMTDPARRQAAAADHAATFALALAGELPLDDEDHAQPSDPTGGRPMGDTTMIARDRAQVGVQAGHIYGGVHLAASSSSASTTDVARELRGLREALRRSLETGELDDETFREAQTELGRAQDALPADTQDRRSRLIRALMRLRGLVHEVADLASKLGAIIAVVQARS